MPRVHTTTKSNRGKTYNCVKCGKPITEGQQFYWWEKRYAGTYRQHTACGYPRRSQLSNAKTAPVEDAITDAQADLDKITVVLEPEFKMEADAVYDLSGVVEECQGPLNSVAEEARSAGEEYESGVQNMPEGLQQGSTGQAMEEVAQELQSWADELDDFSPSTTTVDLPDPGEIEPGDNLEEAWREAAQDAIDTAVGEILDEARGMLDEMPSYQG